MFEAKSISTSFGSFGTLILEDFCLWLMAGSRLDFLEVACIDHFKTEL